MSWPAGSGPAGLPPAEERLRPLYARVLRLRHVDPGGLLCFVFFEGTVVIGLLLALAELVNWWAVLILPVSVATMVKVNDAVAAAVARSAARVPTLERERFRREVQPAVGRAVVPGTSLVGSLRPASPDLAGLREQRDERPWAGAARGARQVCAESVRRRATAGAGRSPTSGSPPGSRGSRPC